MNQTQKVLEFSDGRKITLIGTAHVSNESVEEVKAFIKENKPDCVAVELDQSRCDSLKNRESWQQLDIIKVLKRNEGFLLLANLVLGAFQKRMGKNVNVKPGAEMLAAINAAEELNIPFVLADRSVQTTFRRAWAKSSGGDKGKLLSALLTSGFSSEQISSEEIEELKTSSEMDTMMNELSEYLPVVKEVLIDERDRFIASKIWNSKGNNVAAVVGAGHLNGICSWLEKFQAGTASSDISEIEQVPPKKITSKIAVWIIPVIIIALLVLGFVLGGKQTGKEITLNWILWNGSLAALGALAAAAHPLTVLVSFLGAPITSLCPFVGVGILSGVVQAFFCKPKVQDLENLTDDAGSIKGFYKNKLLRVLLVFILSSLGSSLGTFVAGANIISVIKNIISGAA